MADNVLVCSDATSISEKFEHRSSGRDSYPDIPTISLGSRGKTATDLVKGQEKLLTMLQELKYELSKMDREANRIREDVTRSKQMFSVIFNTAEPLHTKPAPEPIIATVTSSNRKYTQREGDLGLQFLNKISTHTPRRSLLSSYRSEPHSRNFDDIRDRVNRLNHRVSQGCIDPRTASQASMGQRMPSNRTPIPYMTDDQYSGTESDTESTTSSQYCSHSSGSFSTSTYRGSSDSISEDAGSSTESNVTLTSRRSSICGRRTSSFYKQFGETPQ